MYNSNNWHTTKLDLSEQIHSVRKAGLGIYESWDTEECPLSVLTGVRIKRVNFREKIELFDGTNETVRYTGVRSAGLRFSRSSCGG